MFIQQWISTGHFFFSSLQKQGAQSCPGGTLENYLTKSFLVFKVISESLRDPFLLGDKGAIGTDLGKMANLFTGGQGESLW